jgi:hypothetical protein
MSETPAIEAAVERAARAIHGWLGSSSIYFRREIARAALTAAYPHLLAENERLHANVDLCIAHVDLLKAAMCGRTKFVCGLCGAGPDEDHAEGCALEASSKRLTAAAGGNSPTVIADLLRRTEAMAAANRLLPELLAEIRSAWTRYLEADEADVEDAFRHLDSMITEDPS